MSISSSLQTGLLCLALITLAAPSFAQQANGAAAVDETSYADVYNRARERAKSGDWAGALSDYRKAFDLAKGQVDWQAATNHGRAASEQGEHAEAARMFRYAKTRLLPTDPSYADYSSKLDERLAQASALIGTLTITVAPTGAEVVVLGRSEGRAPLSESVFVMPGQCSVEARLDGHRPTVINIQIKAGEQRTVTIQLTQVTQQQTPSAPASVPDEQPRNTTQLGVGVTMVGLGIVGIAASIVLAVTAGNRSDAADLLGAQVDQLAPNGNACGSGSPIETSADCRDLSSNADEALTFRAGAIGAGVAGGVLLAAGVITLIWPHDDDGPEVAAVVTPDFAGLTVLGTF